MKRLLAASLTLSFASTARADMAALVGHGPASIAEARARVARGTDGASARENPGGLALGEGAGASAGVTLLTSRLTVDGAHAGIEDPWATVIAGDATLPLEGALRSRVRLGVGLHAGGSLARILLPHEGDGVHPYWANRSQRLSVVPALALRPLDWLGVGAAVDALAGVTGSVDASTGRSGTPEPRVDSRAVTIARPILGVQARPSSRLALGLTYRGRFAVPLDVSTRANIAGVPLEAEARTEDALFDPREIVGAAAWTSRTTDVELDVGHHAFSSYRGPGLNTVARLTGVNAVTPTPTATYRDAWSIAVGATHRLDETSLRAGVGFETSMMGDRQGATRLVDGSKARVGAGVGRSLLGVRFELGAALAVVLPRTITRDAPPDAKGGGFVLATSLTMGTTR